MSDDFYRAFEEKFRGSRELIKSRLRSYLPFVRPLADVDKGAPTIDLGCGRGEWLELMTEIGFKPYGVDLDEGMLNDCLERNLRVEKGDAVAFLATISSESQAVVSAFHFIEHIKFDQLRTVVSEAIRVLKPGGLLIMETPNPENIVVSTRNFYLDPTHQSLIPPQLLFFLAEYYGFERVKTIRLQESKDIIQNTSLTLRNVLEGVSPDYAIIAQKAADERILKTVDAAFAVEYGLSLETLATHYHAQLEAKNQEARNKALEAVTKAEQAEAKADQAEVKAEQAETKAEQAETKAEQAETKAEQAETKAEQAETKALAAGTKAEQAEAKAQDAQTKTEQAEAKAQQVEQSLHAIYASWSWRITAPLRWFGSQAGLLCHHGLRARVKTLAKKIGNPMAQHVFAYISARPGLSFKCSIVARKLGLYEQLLSLYRKFTGYHNFPVMNPTTSEAAFTESLAYLTPRARRIYANLKAAIEKNKEAS
jgi:SAM-dependent methyltransferase